MTDRHALVIVVPENTRDPRLDLVAVRADATDLEDSLKRSSYRVTTIGLGAPIEVSRSSIIQALSEACLNAPQNGTLLIFFSGHGFRHLGRDCIVPSDADIYARNREDYLVDIGSIARWADESPARQIVFFVDACREGVFESIKALETWGVDEQIHAKKRNLTIVFSCGLGQFSRFVKGAGGYSLFSRAIAMALAPESQTRTLGEVIELGRSHLERLAKDNDLAPQEIVVRGGESDPMGAVICDWHPLAGTEDPATPWENVVSTSRLWSAVELTEAAKGQIALLQRFLIRLTSDARKSALEAATSVGDDAWRDEHYPVRVIRVIEEIVLKDDSIQFAPTEVALLLAAPFVREHAYASAILAHVGKLSIEDTKKNKREGALLDALRFSLVATIKSYPHIAQRLRTKPTKASRRRNKAQYLRRDLILWMLHKHLARFAPMWVQRPEGTLPGNLAVPQLAAALDGVDLALVLNSSRLLKLAKCVQCDVDRLRRTDGPAPLEASVSVSDGAAPIRERLLGSLLCLGGWMALDVRVIGEVAVDHIGLADGLTPSSFVQCLAAARWTKMGRGLQLDCICAHPALDFVVRDLVDLANERLLAVENFLADEGHVEVIQVLPSHLSGAGVLAENDGGRPAYTRPHQKFHLAQTEIRELLMGEQLYGDPGLAIRELYQNALDACRYRQARVEYLARTGRPVAWKGRIQFTQGVAGGRPYVECEDNGIGMGLFEIEACFSRAGRRFSDLPEFLEEQELWRKCQPPIQIWPNSQFGVGALSYFMISDEIEMTTCRVDRNGNPGAELSIAIPGSGSLFRIQPGENPGTGGTRIRLYLKGNWDKVCRDMLVEHLFVADFDTILRDKGGEIVWRPGEPVDQRFIVNTSDPDFWWEGIIGGGRLMADGITVSQARDGKTIASDAGAWINLRGPQKPKLTVNRKSVLELDEPWIAATFEKQLDSLLEAPWLRLTWFWGLKPEFRKIAEKRLVEDDVWLAVGLLPEFESTRFDGHRRHSGRHVSPNLYEHFPFLRSLAFPIRTLGIQPEDSIFVRFLLLSADARTVLNRIELIESHFDLPYDFRPVERAKERGDYKAATQYATDILASLSREAWFRLHPDVQRTALWVSLGCPAPSWVRELVPVTVLDQSSRARWRAKPLPVFVFGIQRNIRRVVSIALFVVYWRIRAVYEAARSVFSGS